jgi:hypothetical protein
MRIKLTGNAIGVGETGNVVDVEDDDGKRLIELGVAKEAKGEELTATDTVKRSSPRKIHTNDDSSTTEPRNPNVDIHAETDEDAEDADTARTTTGGTTTTGDTTTGTTSTGGNEDVVTNDDGSRTGFFGGKKRR